MKRIVLAAAIAGLTAVGAVGAPAVAAAQEAGISTTLSARHWHGRHYGWYRGHHRGWWNHYAGCRVVVRRHINRWGEPVVVRRRVCF
jgi:hypothetical protein